MSSVVVSPDVVTNNSFGVPSGSQERVAMSANKRAAEARAERRAKRNATAKSHQWTDVPSDLLGAFVAGLASDGRAVLLGSTSDQGALTVRIYDNGDAETEYIKPRDDLRTVLQAIYEDYTGGTLDIS